MTQLRKVAMDGTAKETPVQWRLPLEERRRRIVDGAARFFAKRRFDVGTRPLMERLGVIQTLLYRYFPSKGELIEEVFLTDFADN